MIGLPEILVVLVILLLILGPKRLPKLARSIGQSVREYRKASKRVESGKRRVKAGS